MSAKRKTIIRSPRTQDNPYFMCRRATAQDNRLSFEARGVLVYLLSKPDTWEIQPAELQTAGGCGRDRIYRILKELREAGYLVQEQARVAKDGPDKGRFLPGVYILSEEPHTDLSDTAEPHTENPDYIKEQENHLESRESRDSADTPSGGQRHVVELPTPETERKRDPIFEVVIARNFGVALDDKAGVEAVRDKANWITSWLKGNAVKKNSRDKRKSLPGCSPPASPEEVGAFYDWWEREKGIDKPSTALGIAQFMSVFRQERKPARMGPAVHIPPGVPGCSECEGRGMWAGPDGASIPCPACLAAEQAAQEVRDEQAA